MHGFYFVVGAWLSNFCHSLSNFLSTFISKMEFLQKWEKVVRIRKESEEKYGGRVKM